MAKKEPLLVDRSLDARTRGTAKRRSRMRIFRDEDARVVDDEIMPMEGVDARILEGFKQLAGHGLEQAQTIRCLFRDEARGMSLVHIWFKSGFILPQHKHDADCVYYIIAGEIHAGSVVLRQGDGMFIPKDHDYTYIVGPQGVELLEFRNAAQFNIVLNANDAGQWQRMASAAKKNAEAWKRQLRPPARR